MHIINTYFIYYKRKVSQDNIRWKILFLYQILMSNGLNYFKQILVVCLISNINIMTWVSVQKYISVDLQDIFCNDRLILL